MSSKRETLINALLIALVLWDLLLCVLTLSFPDLWFQLFHGMPYVDEQGRTADTVGLLRRTGALWVAFTLFQLVAFIRWRKRPYWLPVVAGIRLTEVFSDWAYIFVAGPHITIFGTVGLFIAPLCNWFFGWFFISSYLKIETTGLYNMESTGKTGQGN
ncbi:MAG: hypothetical protein MJE77_18640 [Proteobacteria bacterium]|nr:hypothetical protein [Pseudomonadota bacterium]